MAAVSDRAALQVAGRKVSECASGGSGRVYGQAGVWACGLSVGLLRMARRMGVVRRHLIMTFRSAPEGVVGNSGWSSVRRHMAHRCDSANHTPPWKNLRESARSSLGVRMSILGSVRRHLTLELSSAPNKLLGSAAFRVTPCAPFESM